jgi:hypothetical protein
MFPQEYEKMEMGKGSSIERAIEEIDNDFSRKLAVIINGEKTKTEEK